MSVNSQIMHTELAQYCGMPVHDNYLKLSIHVSMPSYQFIRHHMDNELFDKAEKNHGKNFDICIS